MHVGDSENTTTKKQKDEFSWTKYDRGVFRMECKEWEYEVNHRLRAAARSHGLGPALFQATQQGKLAKLKSINFRGSLFCPSVSTVTVTVMVTVLFFLRVQT
jgi:hypothetical protein